MPQGTASNKLKKSLMFSMIVKLELDICFQCGRKINTCDEMSVEHKIPWLHSKDPKALFFSLDNIAFSHLKCNIGAARPVNKKYHSEDEKKLANREDAKRFKSKHYTPEKRREQYLRTGK